MAAVEEEGLEAEGSRGRRTVNGRTLQPSERGLLVLVHPAEVARHVQLDLRLEGPDRQPAIPNVRLAHHNERLSQPSCRRQLEHALA